MNPAVDRVDVVVVGAGVVGLAIARALAEAGMDVAIVEREAAYGTGVSSRNSEVIHAGLYYPAGSLRARLCVEGRQRLYTYCASRHVAHARCGKLVVVQREADVAALHALRERGRANGVDDLEVLTAGEARALEPAIGCEAALLSPSSGIVDSHGLMTALLGDAQSAGALLAVTSAFESARRVDGNWRVRAAVTGDATPFELDARWVVNSSGLDAQAVATAMQGFPREAIPRRHLARGHYFSLAGRAPFSRLIYPLPVDGGLGVHLTLDLGGQAKFGPDVQWLQDDGLAGHALDYRVDPARSNGFVEDVRRYWPGVPDDAFAPSYAGIRPKLSGPGEPAADFRIDGPQQHGCEGVVQLFGIESPGLTASLAIGAHVAALVTGRPAG